ncbi:MAG: efflux RND transporter permease subunit, partial [Leptospiraceae bacterium]|nr:efflux RND transporter permease subunit [Leptospiraceae bacterium]
MFDRIVRFSVYRPGLAFLGAFLLLLGSILAFRGLAIDAVPDISNVQVQILTRAGSMDGETIEANITYPIESAMGAVPNVKEVRSVTRFGLSAITVVFEEGADIYRARQLVSEQLQTVDLDAKPRLGPIATGLGEIYHYSLDVKNPSE